MHDPLPTFPPLITGHMLDADIAPADWALARLARGKLEAGDLGWSAGQDDLRFALILEPDVARNRCVEILYAGMVAIGDAIGALSPPEVGVGYRWPSLLLINGAEAGFVDLHIADNQTGDMPDWMVLSVFLQIRPRANVEPGRYVDQTTLWDEGCGNIGRTMLLQSVSRHINNVIHNWSEDGFKPIYEQWWGRREISLPLAGTIAESNCDGEGARLAGLDENGNAIISGPDNKSRLLMTMDALEQLRQKRKQRQ